MPLYWLAYTTEPVLFIVEAEGGEIALMKSSIAGRRGPASEVHRLPADVAKKIPRKMIGKPLSQIEAKALLRKMG